MIWINSEALAIRLAEKIFNYNKDVVLKDHYYDDNQFFKKETVIDICNELDCQLDEAQLYYELAEKWCISIKQIKWNLKTTYNITLNKFDSCYEINLKLPKDYWEFPEWTEITIKWPWYMTILIDQIKYLNDLFFNK